MHSARNPQKQCHNHISLQLRLPMPRIVMRRHQEQGAATTTARPKET